jgi:hypothetical protein
VSVQAGLSWSRPLGNAWMRLDGGYRYDQAWMDATGKDAEDALYRHIGWLNHGPFVRLEIGF